MFKPGDVVRLKSGGPNMTVQRLVGVSDHQAIKLVDNYLRAKGCKDGDPVCQWFVGADLKSESFTKETLELVASPLVAPPATEPPATA